MEKPARGKCVVCSGEIVEKIVNRYMPESGPPIIGPGSKGQFSDVSEGYHCKNCGIKYEFPPGLEDSARNETSTKKTCSKCGSDKVKELHRLVGGPSGHHGHSNLWGYECEKCGHKESLEDAVR